MTVFLERVNAVPVQNLQAPYEFTQWLSNLVDSLNSAIDDIQDLLDLNLAQSYTSAQITDLAASLPDGVILYDSDMNVYVGKQNGALVQFTTAAYP